MERAAMPTTRLPSRVRSHPVVVLLACAVVGSALAVAFNALVTDRLGSTAASDVRSVLAGLTAIGFLTFSMQLALVGWLGRLHQGHWLSSSGFNRRWLVVAAAIGLCAGGAAVAFIDADAAYRLQSGILVAVSVAAAITAVPSRAELLSVERWIRVGFLMVIAPALRVALGLLLLSDHRSWVNFLPIAIAEVAATAFALWLRPRDLERTLTSPPIGYLVRAAGASVGLMLTLVFTSIAFRSRLGDAADDFNSAGVIARAVLFLPLTVTILYFPSIARSRLGSAQLRASYLKAVLVTAILVGVAAAVIFIAPQQLAQLILHDSDEISVSVIRVLTVAWALTAVSIVSLLLHIAHGSRLALAGWVSAAIVVAGQARATTAMQLAIVCLVASLALFAVVSIPAIIRVQPILHATTARPTDRGELPRGDLALVVPCYNPGHAVVATVTGAHQHLAELGVTTSIIVVCDGSTDGSDLLVDKLNLATVVQVHHDHNRGKGAAIRTGFAHAHAEFIAFIDADGDLPPDQLGRLLSTQSALAADIVFGSKLHPDSQVHASGLRRMYSYLYQKLILVLFQLDVRDTQTGIKLFRHDVIDAVLPSLQEEQFALDLELFIAARAAGYTKFVEAPVTLRRQSGSTISVRAVTRMAADTIRLFWRAKIGLAYTRFAATTADPVVSEPGR